MDKGPPHLQTVRARGKGKTDEKGGKQKQGNHTHDRQGKEICHNWNRNGAAARLARRAPEGTSCAAGGTSCATGRAHVCEFCLSSAHRGVDCPTAEG